jgi:hypothetical protein
MRIETGTTGTTPARTLRTTGVGYALCWVVGLTLGGPDLLPDADAAAITGAFADAPAVAVFAILVHGVAAGFLVALGALLPPARRRLPSLLLAITAATLSLLQLVGELLLVSGAGAVDPVTVWTTITVADGVKMIVLAAWIAVVQVGHRRDDAGSPWRAPVVTCLSVATVLALVVTGAGYLVLSAGLMTAAYLSLPLLLVWVLAAAWVRSRSDVEISSPVPSSV